MSSNFFGHLSTVTRHRSTVFIHCCKAGIPWRGFWHDISKFSPTEFIPSVKHYAGGRRSPNELERADYGYSLAWMHHKGRNRHHYEYWTDMNRQTRCYESVPMPKRYLAEMVMDRIAACKTYEGKAYTPASALNYFLKSRERELMHPKTREELEVLLRMLQDRGEGETFRYIRQMLKEKT